MLLRYAFVALAVAAPFAAQAQKITVTASDCDNIVAYTPDPSVAYKPGVDVDGNPVAPADLPGSSMTVKPPEKITIDIKQYLQDRYGIPANKGLYSGETVVGKVVVKDGKAYYNGQPLATGAQNAIAEACRKLRRKR